MIRLSIVVCTYNNAFLLKDALRTLAAQTDAEFELLVVDDGSSDGTEAVVRKHESKFQRLSYLSKPHTGLADSRNFGISRSTGTHIGFLDADDFWSPEYIAATRAFLDLHQHADLVCSNGFRIDESGNVLGRLVPATIPQQVSERSNSRDRLEFILNVTPSAMVFSRDAFLRIGEFEKGYESGTDDIHWLSRAASLGLSMMRQQRSLILYRRHQGNLSNNMDKVIEAWMATYAEHWKNSGDSQAYDFFHRIVRDYVPGVMARYGPERSGQILKRASEVFPEDRMLNSARFLPVRAMCLLARTVRTVKKRFTRPPHRLGQLDLSDSPETIFSTLAKIEEEIDSTRANSSA